MRLELAEVNGSAGLGGQHAFCLGVDETTWETVRLSTATDGSARFRGSVNSIQANMKRVAFLDSHDWLQVHELMVDAGLLNKFESGGVSVCVQRTRAMLVLTAIHDVMKMEELLPTVLVRHSWPPARMRET